MDCEKMGRFIAALRKEQNMTQRDLAGKLLITDKAVSKWERGLACPDISVLMPLSELLGISVAELLEGERLEPVTAEKVQNALRNSIDLGSTEVMRARKSSFRKFCILMIAALLLISCISYAYVQGQKVSRLDTFWEYLFETSIVETGYEEAANKLSEGISLEEYLGLRTSVLTARTHLMHLPEEIQEDYGEVYEMMGVLYDRINMLYYALMQTFVLEDYKVIFDTEACSEIQEDIALVLEQYRDVSEAIESIYVQWKNSVTTKLYHGVRNVCAPWTPPSKT